MESIGNACPNCIALSAALDKIKQKHEESMLHREAEWLNELAGAINDAVYGDCQVILSARLADERKAGAVAALKHTEKFWSPDGRWVLQQIQNYAAQIESGEVKP